MSTCKTSALYLTSKTSLSATRSQNSCSTRFTLRIAQSSVQTIRNADYISLWWRTLNALMFSVQSATLGFVGSASPLQKVKSISKRTPHASVSMEHSSQKRSQRRWNSISLSEKIMIMSTSNSVQDVQTASLSTRRKLELTCLIARTAKKHSAISAICLLQVWIIIMGLRALAIWSQITGTIFERRWRLN